MFAEDYRLHSSNQMRGAARFLVQSATRHIKPVNGLASKQHISPNLIHDGIIQFRTWMPDVCSSCSSFKTVIYIQGRWQWLLLRSMGRRMIPVNPSSPKMKMLSPWSPLAGRPHCRQFLVLCSCSRFLKCHLVTKKINESDTQAQEPVQAASGFLFSLQHKVRTVLQGFDHVLLLIFLKQSVSLQPWTDWEALY